MDGTWAGRRSKATFVMGTALVAVAFMIDAVSAEQGVFFGKKRYVPEPLPVFESTQEKLPSPIYDEDPAYVACYWKTWELAFKNFHEPVAGSGYVSQFIDAAFNQNIFLWDTTRTVAVPAKREIQFHL